MRSLWVLLLAGLAVLGVSSTSMASTGSVLRAVDRAAGPFDGSSSVTINAFTQTDQVVRTGASGHQTLLHIKGPAAPTAFRFKMSLPVGGSLKARPDGGVELLDASGSSVGQVAPPWAKDALGRDLPTRYQIVGSSIVQQVNHLGAVYPVVADPWVIPAYWAYRIIRCGGGAYLGWIASAGWRWYQRAVSVTWGCILAN